MGRASALSLRLPVTPGAESLGPPADPGLSTERAGHSQGDSGHGILELTRALWRVPLGMNQAIVIPDPECCQDFLFVRGTHRVTPLLLVLRGKDHPVTTIPLPGVGTVSQDPIDVGHIVLPRVNGTGEKFRFGTLLSFSNGTTANQTELVYCSSFDCWMSNNTQSVFECGNKIERRDEHARARPPSSVWRRSRWLRSRSSRLSVPRL